MVRNIMCHRLEQLFWWNEVWYPLSNLVKKAVLENRTAFIFKNIVFLIYWFLNENISIIFKLRKIDDGFAVYLHFVFHFMS